MGTGGRFGVVLNRKSRFALHPQAFDGIVVEVAVRYFHYVGGRFDGFGTDPESVVLTGDLTQAGLQMNDRVVDTPVAVVHFVGRNIDRAGQQLVTETDPEKGLLYFQYLLGSFYSVVHGGGVAGAVAEKVAVGCEVRFDGGVARLSRENL